LVAQVRLERGKIEPPGNFTSLYGNGYRNHSGGTELFINSQLEMKRTEFISDRMSYLKPRGNWCDIIALNVPTSSEDETDDKKESLIPMS
jgi:hypothetical protein